MPEDDVSDLRDVFDAINKLCDTMKTSTEFDQFEDCTMHVTDGILDVVAANDVIQISQTVLDVEADVPQYTDYKGTELVSPEEVNVYKVETYSTEKWRDVEVSPEVVDTYSARWSDTMSQISLPGQMEDVETVTSDTEPMAHCEPISEMYFTASSEVSLISDVEVPVKVHSNSVDSGKEGKECVIAGHVAAMRERFESMTRTNTPCPDLARSSSPSLDVFRNITPSPDRLG